ncbi:HET-domain-containing protein [Apiospora hydei]|uniref:HET-domain-containing protein n=1 Tax=Apiospora hydei TaxID=1337664 RepID=A0ABR1WDE6_9PEZI
MARAATIMTSCSELSWSTFTAISRGVDLGYSRTPMRPFLDSVSVRQHTSTAEAAADKTFITSMAPEKATKLTAVVSEKASSFTTSSTETITEDKTHWPPGPHLRLSRSSNRNPCIQRRLLQCLPYLQCARNHDKVYGLYAMASDWGYDLPEPDYGRPIEDVFQEFVVSFLHVHGNVLPLTTTLPANPSTGLPSWVPDWLTSRLVVSDEDVDVSGVFASLYPPDWTATKSSHSYVTWAREQKSLALRGKRIGRIRTRISGTPKDQYDDPASAAFDDFASACQNWIQSLSVSALDKSLLLPQDPTDTSRPKWSAMEQFLLFTPFGPARSRQLGPIFPTKDEHSWEFSWDRVARHKLLLDWLHRTRHPSLDEAAAALGDSPFVDYLQHVSRAPAVLEANFRTMQRHVNLFANYAFLTLDRDGLWARAHLSCQVGDEVWLLAGSDVPVVLRRQGDGNARFRVVGPAYVDGAMYGKMWADDESMLETITLV